MIAPSNRRPGACGASRKGAGLRLLAGCALLAATAPGSARPLCEVSTTGIAFGPTDALHPRTPTSIGHVVVRCEGGGQARVTIALATRGAARQALGEHPRAPDVILFLDPAHGRPWGDGTGGTVRIERDVTADGRLVQIPVYARLRVAHDSWPGHYVRGLEIALDVDAGDDWQPSGDGAAAKGP